MTSRSAFSVLLSAILALILVFLPALSANAAEFSEELPETEQIVELDAPEDLSVEEMEEPEDFPEVEQTPETIQPEGQTPASEETECVCTEAVQEEALPGEAISGEPVPAEPVPDAVCFALSPAVTPIAQAWAMPIGTEDITLEGTVVLAFGTNVVLQDETGGIRLSFAADPGVALGDVLLVIGMRTGGFSVTAFEKDGTAPLPATDTTLLDAPEALRIRVEDATLGSGSLQQNGFTISLIAEIPQTAAVGDKVDVCGVILDGVLYADAVTWKASGDDLSAPGEFNTYFGLLHAHTDISDGTGTVEEAFQHAANVDGLDFFAVTDHSNSFDNAAAGAIGLDGTAISDRWAEGKAVAAEVTDDGFVGIFGYEMTWTEDLALGHINTFNTPGWQTRDQSGFDTLEGYFEALATVPGAVSQFNHPGPVYGGFNGFRNYDPAYDRVVQLLEVGSGNGVRAYASYTKALDQGWHVAPTNNQNNHNGFWGDQSPVRTVVLAEALTEASLYQAMLCRRVYATEDSDLAIRYRLNGQIMGSIIGESETLEVSASFSDPTDAVGTVEVIADGGITVASRTVSDFSGELTMAVPTGYHYYYLRVTQPDGDIAVTAPVWVESYEDVGIESFTSDVQNPEQGQEVTLTLEIYNEEEVPFLLDSVEFSHNGEVIQELSVPGTVNALGNYRCTCAFTWPEAGEVELLAQVTGTVAGAVRTYEKTLTLHYQPASLTESTITQTRSGRIGEAYRIRGFVTAGNSNPYNTFPNTIYVQDDTGGIAVTGTFPPGIQVGAPVEITGCLRSRQGNLVLELTEFTALDEELYRYVPHTTGNKATLDYALHGGELLQVEGEVVSLTKTADGKGISRFTIKDFRGDLATVVIGEEIGSGAYGTNELASQVQKGRTVRAMGLVHVDEFGTTVLRVRNCDEVVYVPPVADRTNPKTGDAFFLRK